MGVALSHTQWSRLNGFAMDLHSDNSREHFFRCCLESLPKMLGISWVGYNEMDEEYRFVGFKVSKAYEDSVIELAEHMEDTISTNALIKGLGLQHRTDPMRGVHLATDFLSERQLKQLPIYREAYRHVDTVHQMYAEMHFTPEVRSCLTLNCVRPMGDEQRLMTSLATEHLVVAFRNLLKSEEPPPWFSKGSRPFDLRQSLSPRLRETLNHLLNGLPRKLIADEMSLSIHTLNDYVREIYARFGVHSHAELLRLFRESGLHG